MGDAVKVVSGHSEYLSDGREVPDGVYALDVDLKDVRNTRLLDERRIVKVDASALKELPKDAVKIPAPKKTKANNEEAVR